MTKDKRNLLLSFLQRFCQSLLEAVFPSKCLICGAFDCSERSNDDVAAHDFADLTLGYFCASCLQDLRWIASPFCSKCGLPFVSREGEDHTCSECLTKEKHFRKARAFGIYDGSLMEAIHRFKYAKRTSLSRPLSALCREAFSRFWGPGAIDLLVPVPLHVKRLRERGFNQAYLLIKRWAKSDGLRCDLFSLVRTRWTEPQTSLSRKERQRNIRGAFAVRNQDRMSGRRILLVDDVYTTGSTVNECARVLMKAGAEFVDVLTLARAV
jgi:ComF family protein